MRTWKVFLVLARQIFYCALQFLVMISVLFAGVLPAVTAHDRAGCEKTGSPFKKQEEKKEQDREEEELVRFSEEHVLPEGASVASRMGTVVASPLGRFSRRVVVGHCLANGLRAPLLQ